jgi:hypothetical protein
MEVASIILPGFVLSLKPDAEHRIRIRQTHHTTGTGGEHGTIFYFICAFDSQHSNVSCTSVIKNMGMPETFSLPLNSREIR